MSSNVQAQGREASPGAKGSAALPAEVLADYPERTACIRYKDGSGKPKDWFIGAAQNDNEETLREHLHRHLPAAEFVGWVIK